MASPPCAWLSAVECATCERFYHSGFCHPETWRQPQVYVGVAGEARSRVRTDRQAGLAAMLSCHCAGVFAEEPTNPENSCSLTGFPIVRSHKPCRVSFSNGLHETSLEEWAICAVTKLPPTVRALLECAKVPKAVPFLLPPERTILTDLTLPEDEQRTSTMV